MKKYMPLISIGTGIIFWIVAGIFTGEEEVWDSRYYVILVLPIFLAINFIFGYIQPNRAWAWGILSTMSQIIPMLIISKPSPYWPIGIIAFFFLSIPAIVASWFGSVFRRAPIN